MRTQDYVCTGRTAPLLVLVLVFLLHGSELKLRSWTQCAFLSRQTYSHPQEFLVFGILKFAFVYRSSCGLLILYENDNHRFWLNIKMQTNTFDECTHARTWSDSQSQQAAATNKILIFCTEQSRTQAKFLSHLNSYKLVHRDPLTDQSVTQWKEIVGSRHQRECLGWFNNNF